MVISLINEVKNYAMSGASDRDFHERQKPPVKRLLFVISRGLSFRTFGLGGILVFGCF
jgi:hypothetical protein